MTTFDELPFELYDIILDNIPCLELQETVLALSRAVPHSPIPVYRIFENLCIRSPNQAISVYNRLRKPRDIALISEHERLLSRVKTVSVETWSVDAEIVLNLARLLPNIKVLNLWIGATNFSPEHLEELFSKPFLRLQYLALRFRPYVQTATYYQFMKGAYFDSTLTALARWPSSVGGLPTVSIIQEALDVANSQTFAQPLVFFSLDISLFTLLHSPVLSPSLTSLCLRIPLRPVVRSLCSAMLFNPPNTVTSSVLACPKLEFLDLSTCGILETDIDTILERFTMLRHLILDGCEILRGDLREGEWRALGKRLALSGVRKAKEREKFLKSWLWHEAKFAEYRRTREDLAVSSSATAEDDQNKATTSKIRVLPSEPSLLSISMTLPSSTKPENYSLVRAEFEEGWEEGIAQLGIKRARLRTSANGGVRVMQISGPNWKQVAGLDGLEDVDEKDLAAYGVSEDGLPFELAAPVLCFAGPRRDGEHEKNCGHGVGWKVMLS